MPRAAMQAMHCTTPGGAIYLDNKSNGTPWSLQGGDPLRPCSLLGYMSLLQGSHPVLFLYLLLFPLHLDTYSLLLFYSLLFFPPNLHFFLNVQSIAPKMSFWGGGVTGIGYLVRRQEDLKFPLFSQHP